MAKFGMKNISFVSDDNVEHYIDSADIEIGIMKDQSKIEDFDFTQPISFTQRIYAKRKGTIFEEDLYYRKSKKKRIRKKHNALRILERGKK